MRIDERAEIGLAGGLSLDEQVQAFLDEVINRALRKFRGNQCHAAKALGIHRNTISRYIDKMLERGTLKASLRRRDYTN